MSVSKSRQLIQVWNSATYDDTQSTGSGMESPAMANENVQWDLNNLRSQIKNILGQTNWYDAISNNFSLEAIHDKLFAFRMPINPGTSTFTLSGGEGGILLPLSIIPGGSGNIAVGGSSTSNGGYIAADESNFTVAGTLGVGLTTATDGDGCLLNAVAIIDDDTSEAPRTATGEAIFGLLGCITGTVDDASIVDNPSENLQISFVYYSHADVLTATTLTAGDYHFAMTQQREFYSLLRGSFINLGNQPSVADLSGGVGARVPYREIDISGTLPAANDPMNVQTGAFTTAGAQTSNNPYGTTILPSSGASFASDSRIRITLNGKELSKGANSGANRDVYWVSTTQVAFEDALLAYDVIHVYTAGAY